MSTLFADAFFFVALFNPRDRAHSLANTYIEPDLRVASSNDDTGAGRSGRRDVHFDHEPSSVHRPVPTVDDPPLSAPHGHGSDRRSAQDPARHVEVVNVLLDSVRDRSEPPSDPILGEPAQTGSPRPRSLPRRAHHLASAYDFPDARQLVRQDGWQAAIFGGRNRPSLLMVAHQLASASEVTSS